MASVLLLAVSAVVAVSPRSRYVYGVRAIIVSFLCQWVTWFRLNSPISCCCPVYPWGVHWCSVVVASRCYDACDVLSSATYYGYIGSYLRILSQPCLSPWSLAACSVSHRRPGPRVSVVTRVRLSLFAFVPVGRSAPVSGHVASF